MQILLIDAQVQSLKKKKSYKVYLYSIYAGCLLSNSDTNQRNVSAAGLGWLLNVKKNKRC